jgi:hypothetical protein
MPAPSKKLTILAVLEILRDQTDAEHPLRQAEIIARLKTGYEIAATRKTVRQNLSCLEEAGYPVEYRGGWYYEHEFCEAELNLLVDSLLFSGYVPYAQCRALIEKIMALGGGHYAPRVGRSVSKPENPQFVYSLEVLQRAIDSGVKVEFQYADFDVDKKLHPRLTTTGVPRLYTVNPYRVVASGGRYYLIGNIEKYDNVAHFRIDRIWEIRELEEPAKPMAEVEGLEHGLDIPEYMAGHAHMFSGKSSLVRIRAKRNLAGDILDWFGMETRFENVTDDSLEAVFRADAESLKYWLRQYAEHAEQI